MGKENESLKMGVAGETQIRYFVGRNENGFVKADSITQRHKRKTREKQSSVGLGAIHFNLG